MRTIALLVAAMALSGFAANDGSTLPTPAPTAPLSVPSVPRALDSFDPPWDTNALGDSMDQSNPPDGALFVSKMAAPDSSIILLGYNYLNGGWWGRMSISVDGGLSYQPFTVDTGFFVDVCLAGNGKDTCWNLSLVSTGPSVYGLYVRPSYDGGLTWGDTVKANFGSTRFPDKPMFTTRGGLMVITFTDFTDSQRRIRLARSSDYGMTWDQGDIDVSESSSQGSCPAIGPDSMVYAVWGQPASWVPTSIWFNKSADSGATWGTPGLIQNLAISQHLNGTRPNHTFPAMACDENGKLYVVCQNMMQGVGWDVAVWTSTDHGDSWAGPFQVNDDSVVDSDQFCPWITLDHYGRPHVFWYDSRNYYPTNDGDVYYSWSEDGGETWAPNERVNDVTPCWVYASRMQMGDYQQIDCDSNYVYCQWSDHRNGRTTWSYIAAARRPLPDYVGVSEGRRPDPGLWQQSRVYLEPNSPNPVVRGTGISFQLPATGDASLAVYDRAGKLVRTLADGTLSAGYHRLNWDGRDDAGRLVASGVYCYRLMTESGAHARQLVIAR